VKFRLRGRDGRLLVLPEFFLVAQGAECHDRHVHVAVREGFLDDGRVGCGVECVEVDHAHLAGTVLVTS